MEGHTKKKKKKNNNSFLLGRRPHMKGWRGREIFFIDYPFILCTDYPINNKSKF